MNAIQCSGRREEQKYQSLNEANGRFVQVRLHEKIFSLHAKMSDRWGKKKTEDSVCTRLVDDADWWIQFFQSPASASQKILPVDHKVLLAVTRYLLGIDENQYESNRG